MLFKSSRRANNIQPHKSVTSPLAYNPICLMVVLVTPFLMAGCFKTKASCSSPEGLTLMSQMLTDDAQKIIASHKNESGNSVLSSSSVRATLSKIIITVEGIRTSKEDPNSTKVFCEGKVKLSVPTDLLQQSKDGRESAGSDTIANQAESFTMEQEANAFKKDIGYNIQPSDDGKTVFAQIDEADTIANFMVEIVEPALLKPILEKQKIQAAKKQAEEEQQAAQLQAEQSSAALAQAQNENQLARQTLNSLWGVIQGNKNQYLVENQKAWVMKKKADCAVEAGNSSTDPSTIEITRLNCDSNANNVRISQLRQWAGQR